METTNQNEVSTPAVKFNSISEIIKDDYFIRFIKMEISELSKQRFHRPNPKQGYKYKRDWYDRMTSQGNFTVDYFINNIGDIWIEKSSLNTESRNIIQLVCNNALNKTLSHYAAQSPS